MTQLWSQNKLVTTPGTEHCHPAPILQPHAGGSGPDASSPHALVFSSHVLHSQSWGEGMGGLGFGPPFGYQY